MRPAEKRNTPIDLTIGTIPNPNITAPPQKIIPAHLGMCPERIVVIPKIMYPRPQMRPLSQNATVKGVLVGEKPTAGKRSGAWDAITGQRKVS